MQIFLLLFLGVFNRKVVSGWNNHIVNGVQWLVNCRVTIFSSSLNDDVITTHNMCCARTRPLCCAPPPPTRPRALGSRAACRRSGGAEPWAPTQYAHGCSSLESQSLEARMGVCAVRHTHGTVGRQPAAPLTPLMVSLRRTRR